MSFRFALLALLCLAANTRICWATSSQRQADVAAKVSESRGGDGLILPNATVCQAGAERDGWDCQPTACWAGICMTGDCVPSLPLADGTVCGEDDSGLCLDGSCRGMDDDVLLEEIVRRAV